MTQLQIGEKAPDFTIKNQNGDEVKLTDFKGKKVILYFYPKDNTPTCTVEACNFRDNFKELQEKGIEILGVSPDSAKKHTNFINKINIPFDLLVDSDLELAHKYGVWGEKKFMGKTFDGIHRETFVIDEKGIIAGIITKVKSKIATEQILEIIESK